MNSFSLTIPTREPATEKAYVKTYEWLKRRFEKETNQPDISPDELVAQVLELRGTRSQKTFRAYKAAVLYYLTTYLPNSDAAIEALSSSSSAGLPNTSVRTSGRKLKQVPDEVLGMLRKKNRERIALHYRHAKGLGSFMESTLLVGLRPNEWAESVIGKHVGTGRKVLRVQNSKHTNGRANGEVRELFIDELTREEIGHLTATIDYFQKAPDLESALLALKHEMETTRMLALGRSRKWRMSVTLYSFRHQFIADAKLSFKDPVLISAMCGHYSTKTAFEHYGARRHGRTRIKVFPTPESVAAVQKRSLEIYSDFVAQRGPRTAPSL